MQISDIIAMSIGGIVGIIVICYLVVNQKQKVKEWLKWAVSEAEKMLGSGTGQLKLRLVYDWFVEKFPVVSAVLPFKVFSAWVDTALETMRKWLDENKQLAGYIGGEQT